METEKSLNAKILKVTKFIKDEYPELFKFIEEMPVIVPDLQNAQIALKELRAYYDALHTLLNNYVPQQFSTE